MLEAIKPKQIVSLLKAVTQTKTKVAEIAGVLGERIKKASENDNVNTRALKAIAAEVRMSEDKRDDYQRALNHYRDIARDAGLFGDEHVGDMVDQATEAEDEATPEERRVREALDHALAEGIKQIAAE